MKVYIAAPWIKKPEAIEVGRRFWDNGIVVTSRWFNHVGDPTDTTGLSLPPQQIQFQASEDINDVLRSDFFIVLNLCISEGKAFETGIAYMANIPIISVGPRSHIFQSLGYECGHVNEAISYLLSRV